MNKEQQLERATEIADARLGVAETLGWPLAIFAATTAHLAWGSWLITIGAFVAGYVGVTARYRSESKQAEDAYNRAAGLGQYARIGQPDRPEIEPD